MMQQNGKPQFDGMHSPLNLGNAKKLKWLMCLALATLLTGCAGVSAFTGGSIPPGRSVVAGQVVQAAGTHTPVPNALVTLVTTIPAQGTYTYRVYTDSKGVFSVNGMPTGTVNNNVAVSISPPSGAGLQQQNFSFLLANNRGTSVIAALPPTTFNLSTIAKVLLVPGASSGSSTAYTAEALDDKGNVLPILPSLILDGGVATLGTDDNVSVVPGTDDSGNPTIIAGITAVVEDGASQTVASTINPDKSETLPGSAAISGTDR